MFRRRLFATMAATAAGATIWKPVLATENGSPKRLVRRSTDKLMSDNPHLVIFSGGTAVNSFATELAKRNPHTTHVLPVSDDGGSTAEILRVLGGVAVGDIRSRCLRLAEASESAEARAVSRLLKKRLDFTPRDEELDGMSPPLRDAALAAARAKANEAWLDILDGDDAKHWPSQVSLWEGISAPYRDTIKAFLREFERQQQRRAPDDEPFNFSNGSIGNFFFAGAQSFYRSLDAAIFTYARVSGMPPETSVLPIVELREVESERRLRMGTRLRPGPGAPHGTCIEGQNNLSHPPDPQNPTAVNKERPPPLPTPVDTVYYLPAEDAGAAAQVERVGLSAHPAVLRKLQECDAVVYGCGSLYTSLAISLVVDGIGSTIGNLEESVPRILMLNSDAYDRETCSVSDGCMSAVDVVEAIAAALNQPLPPHDRLPTSRYVDHILYPEGTSFDIEEKRVQERLRQMGVKRIIKVRADATKPGMAFYDAKIVPNAIAACTLRGVSG
jgi:hypothetical protein